MSQQPLDSSLDIQASHQVGVQYYKQQHAMEAGISSGGMGHFVQGAQLNHSPIKPK